MTGGGAGRGPATRPATGLHAFGPGPSGPAAAGPVRETGQYVGSAAAEAVSTTAPGSPAPAPAASPPPDSPPDSPPPARPNRLRLTPSGLGVVVGSAVLYLTAWRLGQPALAVPALAGLSILVLAVWQAAPPRRLTAHRTVSPPCLTRGDAAEGVLTVHNASRPLRGGIAATDHCQDAPVELWLPALRRHEVRSVAYPLPTARRGVVTMGPLLLTRGDLFGLLRRVTPCGQTESVLVRPRTVALPMLPTGRAQHLEGPMSETAAEGSVAFHSLRAYVPGDDLRRIHWASSARTGSLVTRKMVDASWPRTTVLVDLRPSAYQASDSAELAVDCAASVAVGTTARGFPVTLRTTAGTHRDAGDAESVLDWLALVPADDTGSLTRELALRGRSHGTGALVVVTGTGTAAREAAAISAQRGEFDRVVVIRVAPEGSAAPADDAADPARGWRGRPETLHLTVDSLAALRTQWERHAL